ncbi:MAG: homocysteine S-methyltransferase family protein [Intestinibacillus sp.]
MGKLKNKVVFLDGAMGTMLQKSGLKLGERPELLCLQHPETIENIHRMYLDAGSDIVYANTFGANAHKLDGTGHTVGEVVSAAVSVARRACEGRDAKVALDIGPIGELLEPAGTLSFEEAYEIFREMLAAGERAGADLVVFETMTDLYEVKAGVLAARENTALPVFVTMTFEPNQRTFTGCCIESMVAVLEGLGVDALGINCSLGPSEIFPIAKRLSACTALPLIVKANAGLPDPETGLYDIGSAEFAAQMAPYAALNLQYVGGCCGTTPDYIREIHALLADKDVLPREVARKTVVCSPTLAVTVDGVRVIGERINPTGKKRFQQALREGDLDYILSQGVQQAEAGAHILDVNVGLPGVDEPEMMRRVVKLLQGVVDLPLQIDSSNPDAIEAGLRAFSGCAIVNSVNGEPEVLERILPIVKKYGGCVVGLTLDSGGIPEKAEERFAIAERILNTALSYGIPKENVFIDCLTLTVSAQQSGALETLNAVRMVHDKLGLHTVLGVSNISFGLPNRELITHSFLTLAMANGLDLPIINPNVSAMMDAVSAFNVLYNVDRDSAAYIERFSNAPVTAQAAAPAVGTISIDYAIAKGLKEDARRLTREMLREHDELTIINTMLIPALDRVGDRFEKGEIFLPQLINSAGASCEAFDVIKDSIAKKGAASVSKGKIIVATVKGDIHDIGKNIVKVILENYGYQVIDLGRDVPVETVVDAARREDVRLIGLSALMTTTLPSMAETIKALRASGHACTVFVGGAVLTAEYAAEIGADYYARDAKQSVDIAKKVLG